MPPPKPKYHGTNRRFCKPKCKDGWWAAHRRKLADEAAAAVDAAHVAVRRLLDSLPKARP